jgi:hypothetical protein
MYKKFVCILNSLYSLLLHLQMLPFGLDDLTLETIKKGYKTTLCQKCETDTPDIIPWLGMMYYVEGQQRTWINADMKSAQHQRYIKEVEMRTWNNEDSNIIDHQ